MNISLDTYRKLRLLLMECKSLSMVGCDSRIPDVRFIVSKWIDANPILESLIYLSQNYCYIDELKEHDKDVLMDEMQLGVGREDGDYFMFETYDAFPMELAKALTSLFRSDFKEVLNAG